MDRQQQYFTKNTISIEAIVKLKTLLVSLYVVQWIIIESRLYPLLCEVRSNFFPFVIGDTNRKQTLLITGKYKSQCLFAECTLQSI